MDDTYLPISGPTVQIDTVKPFDIYYKADGTMQMYAASGGEVSSNAREESDNALDTLYIQKKDFHHYQLYIEDVLPSLLKNSAVEVSVKTETCYTAVINIARQLFQNPDTQTIKRYKQAVTNTVNFLFEQENALRMMINLTNFDFSVFNHSVNVGIFSIGLAKELLNEAEHNFSELGAAFFLHDIGKTAIPLEILNKKGPLSNVDWKLMKRHPEEGLRILEEHDSLTNEARIVVSQHHERHNGSGYPKGLFGDRIHVYGKICSIADCFDGLTSKRPYRKEYSTFNALKIMKHEMFKDFDPEYFHKFITLLSA